MEIMLLELQFQKKVLTWLYNVLYMQITNVGNNDGILQLDTNIEIYSKGVENE